MLYTEALAEINKGKIRPLYLLYGEESYLAHQLEQLIIGKLLLPEERDMNLIVLDHDPRIQELANLIETIPFMGDKNVIVVKETAFFKARRAAQEGAPDDVDDKKLLRVFQDMPSYSYVIFTSTDKIDKRRTIYKALDKAGAAVELAPLKPKEVKVWLSNRLKELNIQMKRDALEYFLSVISIMPQVSLGFLENELEKMVLYTGSKNTITRSTLCEVLSAIPEVSVFAMLDALSQKKVHTALELLECQLSTGEHPLKMIALLAREVRLLWQAAELTGKGYSAKMVAEALGVPPFIGEKKIRQSQNFSVASLKNALVALAKADGDLKTGRATNSALEKIIIEMCA
ncbi:MAG: DNA polymerase III subunit delta [Pelosinus sp.]|nr:DNA polymerase III subunit delta [Pelosinus sp.]